MKEEMETERNEAQHQEFLTIQQKRVRLKIFRAFHKSSWNPHSADADFLA